MEADAPRGAGSLWGRLSARRRWVVALAAIGAVAAGSLALLLAGGDSAPQTTIVRNGEVWLQGKITQDTYPTISDGGGTITVNGYEVTAVWGNARRLPGMPEPGTVTGLNPTRDQTGSTADVYAQIIGPH
jgi:hypothetical protein